MSIEQAIQQFWEYHQNRILFRWLSKNLMTRQLFFAVGNFWGNSFVPAVLPFLQACLEGLPQEDRKPLHLAGTFEDQLEAIPTLLQISGISWVDERLEPLWNFLKENFPPAPPLVEHPYFEDLIQTMKLSDDQREILVLLFLVRRNEVWSDFLDDLNDKEKEKAILVACPSLTPPVSRFFRKTCDLRTNGLVMPDRITGINLPFVNSHFALESEVFFTLNGDTEGGFRTLFFQNPQKPLFSLEQFSLSEPQRDALHSLLKASQPCRILFHGVPGTGKSELAKALITSVGLEPLFLKPFEESSPLAQFIRLSMVKSFVNPSNQVLVVDEADAILNTQRLFFSENGLDKGQLNQWLDSYTGKIIFIANQIRFTEDSLLRRFQLTVDFPETTPLQSKKFWSNLATSYPRITPEEVQHLASRFPVTPAQISQALTLGQTMLEAGLPRERMMASVKACLTASQKLLGRKPMTLVNQELPYSWDWINIDTDPQQLLTSLIGWKNSSKVGIAALFYGLPGTGKTLLGRKLAELLDLPLSVQKASDLLGPFVGQTEQNIRRAFASAEGGVLMIDEADSFFQDRNLAHHQWERTQTNEMLSCLEDFNGLFIATTNLPKIFDDASYRRFALKIKFESLREDQKLGLLQAYFPQGDWTNYSQELQNLMLTPGDLKAVYQQCQWGAPADPAHVIKLLRQNQGLSQKVKPIGF